MRHFGIGIVSLLAAAGVAGCAIEQGGEVEDIGLDSEAILNGNPISSDTFGSPNWGCSSVLLRDQWIITASHCNPSAGATISLVNGQTAQLTNPIYKHPKLDVTIARLSAPLVPDGSPTSNGPMPLYMGSEAQLLNKSLFCEGWGVNSCSGGTCTGGGTLRFGVLAVDQVSTPTPTYCYGGGGPECYRLTATNGYLNASGDSGGGCWLPNGQKTQLTGIQSTWNGVDKNWQVGAPAFRDWAKGIIGSAPALGSITGLERADTVSDVLYVNPSSHVIELGLGANGWQRSDLTNYKSLPSALSALTGVVRSDGFTSVAFRSSSNHILELALQHGGDWSKTDLTPSGPNAVGDPSSYARSDRTAVILYRDVNNKVRELSRGMTGGWSAPADLTAITGAPDASSDPVGYVRADGTNAVVYRSADNHVRELWLSPNGWSHGDLTAITGAPGAVGKPRPFTRSDGTSVVLYRDSNGHVSALELANGIWRNYDLNGWTAGPAVMDPVGYVRSDGVTAIIYKTQDQHIHELTLSPGRWSDFDMTLATGAPIANGLGLSAYVRADRVNAVVFRTSDHHLHEISLPKGGGAWSYGDLTNAAGGAI